MTIYKKQLEILENKIEFVSEESKRTNWNLRDKISRITFFIIILFAIDFVFILHYIYYMPHKVCSYTEKSDTVKVDIFAFPYHSHYTYPIEYEINCESGLKIKKSHISQTIVCNSDSIKELEKCYGEKVCIIKRIEKTCEIK